MPSYGYSYRPRSFETRWEKWTTEQLEAKLAYAKKRNRPFDRIAAAEIERELERRVRDLTLEKQKVEKGELDIKGKQDLAAARQRAIQDEIERRRLRQSAEQRAVAGEGRAVLGEGRAIERQDWGRAGAGRDARAEPRAIQKHGWAGDTAGRAGESHEWDREDRIRDWRLGAQSEANRMQKRYDVLRAENYSISGEIRKVAEQQRAGEGQPGDPDYDRMTADIQALNLRVEDNRREMGRLENEIGRLRELATPLHLPSATQPAGAMPLNQPPPMTQPAPMTQPTPMTQPAPMAPPAGGPAAAPFGQEPFGLQPLQTVQESGLLGPQQSVDPYVQEMIDLARRGSVTAQAWLRARGIAF